jgi:hypothetical protein
MERKRRKLKGGDSSLYFPPNIGGQAVTFRMTMAEREIYDKIYFIY